MGILNDMNIIPAGGVLLDECNIDGPHFHNPLGHAGQQGQIAADMRLHVLARHVRAKQQAAQTKRKP